MNKIKYLVENIKDYLIENNLSIYEFSKVSGVSKSNLYVYIKGYTFPSISNTIKIANYMNCSIESLISNNGLEKIVVKKSNNYNFYLIFTYLLRLKKLNINQFSVQTKIKDSTIYTWKRKNYIPRLDLLIVISDFFGVSIDYLLGRSDY